MSDPYRDDDAARGALLVSLEVENEDLQAANLQLTKDNERLRAIASASVGRPVRVLSGDDALAELESMRVQMHDLMRMTETLRRTTLAWVAVTALSLFLLELWLRL